MSLFLDEGMKVIKYDSLGGVYIINRNSNHPSKEN